jgi:glycosyltransferase involved in cell wall biosynthesis
LINVGRLAHQKNHRCLLDALPLLPEAHVVLVGHGELINILREHAQALQVADRVHFIGEVSSKDVTLLLHAADVFVFPSWYEGMGLAAIEAMSHGLPMVVSNIPVMHEVLGDVAMFVSPDKPGELAGAIRRVLQDAELASLMRQRGKERAFAFSVERMVLSYEENLLRD